VGEKEREGRETATRLFRSNRSPFLSSHLPRSSPFSLSLLSLSHSLQYLSPSPSSNPNPKPKTQNQKKKRESIDYIKFIIKRLLLLSPPLRTLNSIPIKVHKLPMKVLNPRNVLLNSRTQRRRPEMNLSVLLAETVSWDEADSRSVCEEGKNESEKGKGEGLGFDWWWGGKRREGEREGGRGKREEREEGRGREEKTNRAERDSRTRREFFHRLRRRRWPSWGGEDEGRGTLLPTKKMKRKKRKKETTVSEREEKRVERNETREREREREKERNQQNSPQLPDN